jgi:hypothetical protein
MDAIWTETEKQDVSATLACSFIGTPATIGPQLERFIAETRADELIVATSLTDHAARLRSYELLAEAAKPLA